MKTTSLTANTPTDDAPLLLRQIKTYKTTAIVLLLLLVLAYAVAFSSNVLPQTGLLVSQRQSDWGQFGDFVGGLMTPLVLLLGLLLLGRIAQLQLQQFAVVRQEWQASQVAQGHVLGAHNTQAELAQKQSRQVDIQNFEALFFQLLQARTQAGSGVLLPASLGQGLQHEPHPLLLLHQQQLQQNKQRKAAMAAEFAFLGVLKNSRQHDVNTGDGVFVIEKSYFETNQHHINPKLLRFLSGLVVTTHADTVYHLKVNAELLKWLDSGRDKLLAQQKQIFHDNQRLELSIQQYHSQFAQFKAQLHSTPSTVAATMQLVVDGFERYYRQDWDSYYQQHLGAELDVYVHMGEQLLALIDQTSALKLPADGADALHLQQHGVGKQQQKYANIYKAQLHDAELRLLFWYGLGTEGRREFKALAEKYGLFEHLRWPDSEQAYVFHPFLQQALSEYSGAAFGNNGTWQNHFQHHQA